MFEMIIAIGFIIMGLVSAYFWMVEAGPFLRSIRKIRLPGTPIGGAIYAIKVLVTAPKLIAVAIDIAITVLLINLLGLTGSLGALMGLSISNVIGYEITKTMREIGAA